MGIANSDDVDSASLRRNSTPKSIFFYKNY